MNNVELLFCLHPADARLVALVAKLGVDGSTFEDRAALLGEVRARAAAELATATARWTPYYDRALRLLVAADDDFARLHDYDESTFTSLELREARDTLARHARMRAILVDAERRGARTLGEAYDTCSISTSQARDWFELSPDMPAMLERLRAACEAYLATYRDVTDRTIVGHVRETIDTEHVWGWVSRAPLELFALLGNPFDPTS